LSLMFENNANVYHSGQQATCLTVFLYFCSV
jgi:hypothetical protein